MSPPPDLAEADVRQMVRLLGETAALEGGHAEKKRYLMDGLCLILNVDAWIWALGKRNEPESPQCFFSMLHKGFDDQRFALMQRAVEYPEMGQITDFFFREIEAVKAQVTKTRHEVDPQRIGFSGEVGAAWKNADVGSLIMSGFPVEKGSVSCIGLYRRLEDSEFTNREKQIAHIILSEVPWLHYAGWPQDYGREVPKLSPRQRSVLNLLLEGHGRKEIAHLLEISENTVSGYTKGVYRHFGVQSHAQLMRKFLKAETSPPT